MIEIVFFTSSKVKLEHAKYLCRQYDVRITGFREKTYRANYSEPRIDDREQLLQESYQDAKVKWLKVFAPTSNKFFIMEDTSVIIKALSNEDQEVPGVDVKYWMEQINFEALDNALKNNGNDRSVTVRSDLILHFPEKFSLLFGSQHNLHFSSNSNGYVVSKECDFQTNAMYPWLDNKTFNKWFSLDRDAPPISVLPIEDANKGDFRADAFNRMLEALEKVALIKKKNIKPFGKQINFEEFEESTIALLVVCGPSCAGKTTIAKYLVDNFNYHHFEASDFMLISYYQRHGVSSTVRIGDFAAQALIDKPEIVAEQILQYLSNDINNSNIPRVITGFRSINEIQWLRENYSNKIDLIYIDADQDVRFKRVISRKRDGDTTNFEAFKAKDEQQVSMGLLEIRNSLDATILPNNNTLDSLYNSFKKISYIDDNPAKIKNKPNVTGLESIILQTLFESYSENECFSTTEISRLINGNITNETEVKNKNNVSRYFNQHFRPYYQIESVNGIRKYRLSNTGYSLAFLLKHSECFGNS